MKLEDYLATAPESKCDLVDGNYFHHSPASYRHNELRGFFESVIRFFVDKHHVGEVISENFPVKLNENNWREPDLDYHRRSFERLERYGIYRNSKFYPRNYFGGFTISR